MSVQLDHNFFDHPKVFVLTPGARLLYIAGLCYADRLTTDGQIPNAAIKNLLSSAPASKNDQKLLVSSGFWDEIEGGFAVHNYLNYQNSAEKIGQRRAANRKRQQEFRERNRENSNDSNSECNALRNALHVTERNDPNTTQHNTTQPNSYISTNVDMEREGVREPKPVKVDKDAPLKELLAAFRSVCYPNGAPFTASDWKAYRADFAAMVADGRTAGMVRHATAAALRRYSERGMVTPRSVGARFDALLEPDSPRSNGYARNGTNGNGHGPPISAEAAAYDLAHGTRNGVRPLRPTMEESRIHIEEDLILLAEGRDGFGDE